MATKSNVTGSKSSHSEDNVLIIYRLGLVEAAVKEVNSKLDTHDSVKKTDLKEFQVAIIERFNDVKQGLEVEIEKKADQKQVDDLKTLIKSVGAIFGSVISAMVVYYLTQGNK